jgi:hypothetical protein
MDGPDARTRRHDRSIPMLRECSDGQYMTRPEILSGKHHKPLPHEFVLEALAPLAPLTRTMFGCLAVYVDDKIMLILRDRPKARKDNGVWLATVAQHHESLRQDFPRMRSIGVLGENVTNWQILPVDAPDFEESVRHACELIRAGDPRIGKVPKPKKRRLRRDR